MIHGHATEKEGRNYVNNGMVSTSRTQPVQWLLREASLAQPIRTTTMQRLIELRLPKSSDAV